LTSKIKEIIPKPFEIIYNTKVSLDGRDTPIRSIQTNLGGVITEAMFYAYQGAVDCALINSGSYKN
jgi:5'-nucleotidase/UDP-sugar diphosphatase